MAKHLHTREQLASVFDDLRTVAVVGAHPDASRAAYYVPEYLHHQGVRIIPVNERRTGQTMWGEPVRATLAEIAGPVDVVCFFRRGEAVPEHQRDLLSMEIRPTYAWLQLGIRNAAFAERMVAEGISVVQDRCMLVEHKAAGLSALG